MPKELHGSGKKQGSPNATTAEPEFESLPSDIAGAVVGLAEYDSDAQEISRDETQLKILEQLAALNEKIDLLIRRQSDHEDGEIDSSTKNGQKATPDVPSEWEQRKAAVLKSYGSDSEPNAPAESPNLAKPLGKESKQNPAAPEQCSCGNGAVSPRAAAEPEEILEMRKKLEEKLRQSEIEISIERAKLARLQQDLDVHKDDMERNFAKREEELNAAGKKRKARWKRFLS